MTPTETKVSVGFFMLNYLWVGLGGAFGSVLRFWLSGLIFRHFADAFPLGTLVINVSGSFLIGLLVVLTGPDGRMVVSPSVRDGLLIGILGGYTTFSSFSLQTLNLARAGDWTRAGLNVVLSVVVCLVAVWLGHALGRYWISLRTN
jgi:CrcB protein